MQSSPTENWLTFLFMFVITALILFDFTWFREQFCIIMCPYGRIQSLLMDDTSLAVIYDENRGEPRKAKDVPAEKQGDCVDCGRCVSVCPTGIDIRRGVQMECIACTACIDACDEIMTKVNKPKGLIRYDSVQGIQGKKKKILTPRLALYSLILTLGFSGLVYAVATKDSMDVTILRGNDKPYQVIEGTGDLTNHYKLVLKNRTSNEQEIRYEIREDFSGVEMIAPQNPISLKAGEHRRISFFLRFQPELTKGKGNVMVPMVFYGNKNGENLIEKEVSLVGPIE